MRLIGFSVTAAVGLLLMVSLFSHENLGRCAVCVHKALCVRSWPGCVCAHAFALWSRNCKGLIACNMHALQVTSAVSRSNAGSKSEAQQVSWEQKSIQGTLHGDHAVLLTGAAGRGTMTPALKARFTSLGLYADLQNIDVAGTRFDDGCDRSATSGCKGVKMWVAKGATYPTGLGPDGEKYSAETLRALADVADPELEDLNAPPSAGHEAEVADILETPVEEAPPLAAAQDCDSILDMAAWLACEEAKRP